MLAKPITINNDFKDLFFFFDEIYRKELTIQGKKTVVFADGIIPGEGTSASDNNSDDDDQFSTKKMIARSKHKKRIKSQSGGSSSFGVASLSISNKENALDKKVKMLWK